jgi:hypothetical protein
MDQDEPPYEHPESELHRSISALAHSVVRPAGAIAARAAWRQRRLLSATMEESLDYFPFM